MILCGVNYFERWKIYIILLNMFEKRNALGTFDTCVTLTFQFTKSLFCCCFASAMSEINSDSSTSESEVSACSSKFDPVKALYSKKAKAPVKDAPLYENVQQYEAAQKNTDIIPVGLKELVEKREQEKKDKKLEEERRLQEKNRQRFAKYERKF